MVRGIVYVFSNTFSFSLISYDREFLLQFQTVCTGKPTALPSIDPFWRVLLAPHENYQARIPRTRAVHKGVQTDELSVSLQDRSPQDQDISRDAGCNTDAASQASTKGDATPHTADTAHDPLDKEAVQAAYLRITGQQTNRAASFLEGPDPFEHEMQNAQRELLEAQVARLEAEMKVMRLELARVRRFFGMT